MDRINAAFAIKREALDKLTDKEVEHLFGAATDMLEEPEGTLYLWEQTPQTVPTNEGLGHLTTFAYKNIDIKSFRYTSTMYQGYDAGQWDMNPWRICCQTEIQLVVDNSRWP